MVDVQEFKRVMAEVVGQELPEERQIFEMVGDDVLEKVVRGSDPLQGGRRGKGDFGFGVDPKIVLSFIQVAIALYKIVKELSEQRKSKPDVELIRASWLHELKARGIDDNRASSISNKFALDVERLLESSK